MITTLDWDHVSIASSDMKSASIFWQDLFGFEKLGEFHGDDINGTTFAMPGRSHIGLEIIEPSNDDSYLRRFLDGPSGPGLHHLAFRVPSIEDAIKELRDSQIEPWGESIDDEGTKYAYIHPRSGGEGVLFQLYEADQAWNVHELFSDDEPAHLGITALNHICHVTASRDTTGDWYEELFGLTTIWKSDSAESSNDPSRQVDFKSRLLDWPTGQSRIELLEPYGEDSFLHDFLDKRGPGLHHMTFQVSDFDQALNACRDQGINVFGGREGHTRGGHWRETFIHPRDSQGVLVQFFWEDTPGIWI